MRPSCIFKVTLGSVGVLWNLLSRSGLPERRGKERNRDGTCMPSWPDIPIPTSAAWIILTSFAPSPRVGRQDGTITMQEKLPPSKEGHNLGYADYFSYYGLPCILIRRTDTRHQAGHQGSGLGRRFGSTRAKPSIRTGWVVTQPPQHHWHEQNFVVLLGQIHMLRSNFATPYCLWIWEKFYSDDNVTSQF